MEFVALRIYTEVVEALRYKLRTFGVNLEGPAEVYCDNKSVVKNSSVPVSVLNKNIQRYMLPYSYIRLGFWNVEGELDTR